MEKSSKFQSLQTQVKGLWIDFSLVIGKELYLVFKLWAEVQRLSEKGIEI